MGAARGEPNPRERARAARNPGGGTARAEGAPRPSARSAPAPAAGPHAPRPRRAANRVQPFSNIGRGVRIRLPQRGWLFGLDGTIYLGEVLIPGAADTIGAL